MKYKLLVVSLVALIATAYVPQGMKRLSQGRALTNHWAMAMLFWGAVLDAPETPATRAQLVTPSTTDYMNVSRGPASDSQEEFRWQGRVQPGQTLEIKGVNGNVRAEGYNGNQVEVVATKRGIKSDPKSVEIRVLEHSNGVTICAVYPSDDPSRPNDCQAGRGGHMNVNDNDVEVNFIVKVPAGIRFAGRTVNGEVEARDIGGDVQASTVNGSIHVTASGIVEASTVNGSINAAMGNANWASELKFNTVNGSIIIDFPSTLSTDVSAETLNGDFNSDFPMNPQNVQEDRRGRPKRVTGTIGSGGRQLQLKTINGDIKLRRGSDRAV